MELRLSGAEPQQKFQKSPCFLLDSGILFSSFFTELHYGGDIFFEETIH